MLTLSGCSFLPAKSASRTQPPAPPVPPAPTSSAPPSLPQRPEELPLAHLDACSLLTDDQRAQLGFDRDPLPDTEPGFGDAATCSYRDSKARVAARVALITTEGIGVWTDDTAQVEATPVVVANFPALVVKTPDLEMSCNVEVDVANGQHLDILYRDDGAKPPAPLDQLCSGAQRVAENVVTTLAHPPANTDLHAHPGKSSSTRPTDSNPNERDAPKSGEPSSSDHSRQAS